ncbi:unnamed protein product [Owenia fusiformis]|uniref:E3 ubiquitin-protein ligase RNF170 n=1 Tax=Owenia fusiformis TaxID=6347 RepID=A0A8S4N0X3_OWEFU|nr:unnamed protein product [Owenia fusiformis]
MDPQVNGTLIEGIGDELLYVITIVVAAICVGITLYFRSTQDIQHRIHPASEADVNNTRERLGNTQNGNAPHMQNSGSRHSERREAVITCPICLGDALFAIETNCGHIFCGQCIITYWQHGTWLGAVACPVCRQQVSLLLFHFTDGERNSESEEKNEVMREINLYNRRFSGEPRDLMDYLRDLPTLLRHAFTEFFSVGGLIWMFRLRIIVCFFLALVYFLSPLDIIPEAMFGILGFLDDFFILLLLAIYISIIYRRFVESRAHAVD